MSLFVFLLDVCLPLFPLLLLILLLLFDFVQALPVGELAEALEFARVAANGDRISW